MREEPRERGKQGLLEVRVIKNHTAGLYYCPSEILGAVPPICIKPHSERGRGPGQKGQYENRKRS